MIVLLVGAQLIMRTFGYAYFWSGQFDWLWRFTFGCGGLIDSAFGCGDSRLVVAISFLFGGGKNFFLNLFRRNFCQKNGM